VKLLAAGAVTLFLIVLALAGLAVATTLRGVAVGIAGLRAGAPVPAELVPIIETAAATCPQVTAPLLAAQLRQESGFRADAVSSAGAQGIAQFLPGTWSTWGRDEDGDGVADPFDPADAIPADARLLCALVARVPGSGLLGAPVALALAGYNAGWGAVLHYGGIPPYPQTQRYVQAILSGMTEFAAAV
jgi:peptidoglycan DL-endopeptidase RipA